MVYAHSDFSPRSSLGSRNTAPWMLRWPGREKASGNGFDVMALDGFQARLRAPFAVIGVRVQGEVLSALEYLPVEAAELRPLTPFAAEVCRQLGCYIDDAEFRFDLPYITRGTEFQRRVWAAVRDIPPGEVLSYADVAKRVRSAPRPVGLACGANRLPLVIPCHRVVGSRGIGGFMHATRGRGIDIKHWLLAHEGALS